MDSLNILEEQAVEAAIANQWERAIELNKEIISQNKHIIGAHLRLGFACLQSKQIDAAAKAYKAALRIQPKNQLALDNLERIEILQKQSGTERKSERKKLDPSLFLDIPGKTKTVQLTNLGQKQHLADLYIGEEVDMKLKKRRLEVRSLEGDYIGSLPDDISKRIQFFIDNNSVYQGFIKEASLSRILIFIREISKGDKVKNFISFPASSQPMTTPVAPSEDDPEGSDDMEDDDGHDELWTEGVPAHDHDEENSKQDLLNIHTESDDEDNDD